MTGFGAVAPTSRELAARAWGEVAELVDEQLSPLGMLAIEALGLRGGEAVLDVGCGAGQTVLQLAQRVGDSGRVVGVDVAPGILAVARRRVAGVAGVELVEGDAAGLGFADGSFDCVYSRFGVMSFSDPLAAFRTFRRLLGGAGRLAFVCWRPLSENDLDLVPLRAAGLEAAADPAPFSFADPTGVRDLLDEAGFGAVVIQGHDVAVSCGGVDGMLEVVLRVGPLGRLVRETPGLRAHVEGRVRAALAARDGVLRAAVWVVSGRV